MPDRSLASRSGRDIAERVLGRLLDRAEARTGRRNRIIESVPRDSLLYDEMRELRTVLARAEAEGAVELVKGRHEERDYVVRATLLDPEPLYRLLGRRRPNEAAAAAKEAILERLPGLLSVVRSALDLVGSAWSEKRNLIRDLGPDDVEDAVCVFKAAAALLRRRRDDGMDIRTFSRRAVGDSKFVEGNAGKVADVLRLSADLPGYFDAWEMLSYHGIKRFPQACLLAGPVTYKGVTLPTEPYVGVAPEMSAFLGVVGEPKWLLTIENLASFNRQVREVADPNGIIVYTGGFPSESTLAAIMSLARATDCPIFHWGDVDAGGVKIAYHIEQVLAGAGRRLALHLMNPDIAVKHGAPEKPSTIFKMEIDAGSVVAELLAFMASDGACSLEQEELDPISPRL